MLSILTQTTIVPTFVTKVTEYLCWGWVFVFDEIFFIIQKVVLSLELKFGKMFHLWLFFVNYEGLRIAILANLGQLSSDRFRAINVLAGNQSVIEVVPS